MSEKLPIQERSQWYCAFLLQQWKREVAPLVRKAYRTDDPAVRLGLLRRAAPFLPSREGCEKVCAELEEALS